MHWLEMYFNDEVEWQQGHTYEQGFVIKSNHYELLVKQPLSKRKHMKLKELLSADTDVVAGVIITVEGKILLCLRSKDGEWSIPKGHVQVSEAPVEGALRELAEETDIYYMKVIQSQQNLE